MSLAAPGLTFLKCRMKAKSYLLIAAHLGDGITKQDELVVGLEPLILSHCLILEMI